MLTSSAMAVSIDDRSLESFRSNEQSVRSPGVSCGQPESGDPRRACASSTAAGGCRGFTLRQYGSAINSRLGVSGLQQHGVIARSLACQKTNPFSRCGCYFDRIRTGVLRRRAQQEHLRPNRDSDCYRAFRSRADLPWRGSLCGARAAIARQYGKQHE